MAEIKPWLVALTVEYQVWDKSVTDAARAVNKALDTHWAEATALRKASSVIVAVSATAQADKS